MWNYQATGSQREDVSSENKSAENSTQRQERASRLPAGLATFTFPALVSLRLSLRMPDNASAAALRTRLAFNCAPLTGIIVVLRNELG